jgi:hypothetical protein
MPKTVTIRTRWEPYPGEEYMVVAEFTPGQKGCVWNKALGVHLPPDPDEITIVSVEDEEEVEYEGMAAQAQEDRALLDRLVEEAKEEMVQRAMYAAEREGEMRREEQL